MARQCCKSASLVPTSSEFASFLDVPFRQPSQLLVCSFASHTQHMGVLSLALGVSHSLASSLSKGGIKRILEGPHSLIRG